MISAHDYAFLTQLLKEQSGLALGDGREYLVESRLAPVAASAGLNGIPALVARIRATLDLHLIRAVCEAMATYESSFFRDTLPFTLLRDRLLPALLTARATERRLRIWSAAASTGQEAYTLAMLLTMMRLPADGWKIDLVATDFSRTALERARGGLYTEFEVQRGLTAELRDRFFRREPGGWRIDSGLRQMVSFRETNLTEPFPSLGRFDLVLCRNVLIYFDVAMKRTVLERIASVMAPDGYLLLGAAETAVGITERLARMPEAATNVFRPAPPAQAQRLAS